MWKKGCHHGYQVPPPVTGQGWVQAWGQTQSLQTWAVLH